MSFKRDNIDPIKIDLFYCFLGQRLNVVNARYRSINSTKTLLDEIVIASTVIFMLHFSSALYILPSSDEYTNIIGIGKVAFLQRSNIQDIIC